jgi:hypothetical protein
MSTSQCSIEWRKCVLVCGMFATFAASDSAPAETRKPDFHSVPGTVIHHSPADSGIYVGSPGIVQLANGDYLAKCDEFGPRSTEETDAITRVFRSNDRGQTWTQLPAVHGIYWASVFTHNGAVHLMGPEHHFGRAVIMKSTDSGETWSTPKDDKSGLLLANGRYHNAPVPIIIHDGRIWRCMENFGDDGKGPLRYRAFFMSAPVDADLLLAANWTTSNYLSSDGKWLDGKFEGWLEGNAVVTPSGELVDILRVNGPLGRLAAMVHSSPDGRSATFDSKKDFVDFPGGAKKFTIRHDAKSNLYWSLTNYVLPADRNLSPGSVRNTLALIASPDLKQWDVRSVLLHHSDTERHAFQYVDWQFDGDDLIVASRTAYDDGLGGAHNAHDANFMTFHRVKNFRSRSSTAGFTIANSPADR